MKRIFLCLFLFFILSSSLLFGEEIVAEAPSLSIYPEDSYIPLDYKTKTGIYWGLKSISLGLSSAHLISEFIYPVLPDASRETLLPLFDSWCHRFPSRSFHYSNGIQMPLCARCTGMNVGIFLGHFDNFIWDSFQIEDWERWEQGLLHIGTYSLLTLPLIIDGAVQYNNYDYVSNNPWRVTTGILFGYAFTAIADEVLQLILDYSTLTH